MKMKAIILSSLALTSAAGAASVSVIPHTNLPADAPTIPFTDLTATYNSPITTYTALDLTITAQKIYALSYSYYANGVSIPTGTMARMDFNSSSRPLLSFAQDVRQIAFKEAYMVANSITLFADAAGTQPLGTFDTTHPHPVGTPTYFAFQSDVPFRSFSANVSNSMFIDDLRYSAVPEPAAIAAVGLVVAAAGLRRRRA